MIGVKLRQRPYGLFDMRGQIRQREVLFLKEVRQVIQHIGKRAY
ncbi:MAG TPA: hypothetical protein VNZ53_44730 [Steroidobacteraceae bacterium]|nr:hypothetical protein [Steroidobacteraceae bacterium]